VFVQSLGSFSQEDAPESPPGRCWRDNAEFAWSLDFGPSPTLTPNSGPSATPSQLSFPPSVRAVLRKLLPAERSEISSRSLLARQRPIRVVAGVCAVAHLDPRFGSFWPTKPTKRSAKCSCDHEKALSWRTPRDLAPIVAGATTSEQFGPSATASAVTARNLTPLAEELLELSSGGGGGGGGGGGEVSRLEGCTRSFTRPFSCCFFSFHFRRRRRAATAKKATLQFTVYGHRLHDNDGVAAAAAAAATPAVTRRDRFRRACFLVVVEESNERTRGDSSPRQDVAYE
jgi:hypothetical protein